MAYMYAQTNKAYISTVTLMDEREILDQVMDITNEERTILDIMEMTGRMKRTKQPSFNHFENKYVFKAAVITVIDGTKDGQRSGSDNLNLLLTVGSEDELPVIDELALLKNKKVGRVRAVDVSAKTFEIEPLTENAGDELDATGSEIATTQGVAFFTTAAGEGTTSPKGRRSEWTRSENYIQIFKESNEITDIQDVSTIEVNYKGKPHVLYKLQHDTFLRFRAKIAYGLLAGRKSKTTDNDSNTVWTTQGLWNYILKGDGDVLTTGGYELALSGGTISKANLRTLNRQLDKNRGPSEYWGWVGGDLRADIDDLFVTMEGLRDGGIQYNSWGRGNGKQRAIDMGVDSTRLYGRTIHWKTLDAFDHPEVFAAPGFDYAQGGFLIPTDKIKVDASGNRADRICVRWMPVKGEKYFENKFGKLAPNSTNDQSVLGFSYQGNCGLQAVGMKHFGLISA